MNIKYRNKFKDWYKEVDDTYNVMGSDDIDYLFSIHFLNRSFGCETYLFNDFSTIYCREDIDINELDGKKLIAVDLDTTKGKCFGNHVTYLQNPFAINLNSGVQYGCQAYLSKYAGSTLITVLSLYDFPISRFTEEQLEVLICVDAGFKQYYFNKELFKYYYEDVLEYPQFIDIVSKHDKQYFYDIINKYKLYKKIYINKDGYLETKIKLDELSKLFNTELSLPNKKFKTVYYLQNRGMNMYRFMREVEDNKIFSSACTGKTFIKASVKY